MQGVKLDANSVVSEDTERYSALEALALAAEQRYGQNARHTQRVGILASDIARFMGVPKREAGFIEQAAPLHDIGTIYLPEEILQKPDKLTQDEYELVKSHVQIGQSMILDDNSSMLRTARLIIETHHERWDGSGYPHGLTGVKIPRVGQIVAISDVFDTLTHDRPYRKAWALEAAIEEIMDQSGTAFDPEVAKAFHKVILSKAEHRGNQERVLLQGQLNIIGLYDLLNSFAQNTVTGKLRLYTSSSEAIILLHAGKIIHARIDASTGEEAMVTILTKTEQGTTLFRLESWEEDFPEEFTSIERPTTQLLLSAAVQFDKNKFETIMIGDEAKTD